MQHSSGVSPLRGQRRRGSEPQRGRCEVRSRISRGADVVRTGGGRMQRRVGIIALMFATLVLVGNGRAGAAPPALDIDPQQATGCCVCRGTRSGEQQSIRSCTDGVKVEACVAACRTQGGASIGFGYQQSCSQNCAGFQTQH